MTAHSSARQKPQIIFIKYPFGCLEVYDSYFFDFFNTETGEEMEQARARSVRATGRNAAAPARGDDGDADLLRAMRLSEQEQRRPPAQFEDNAELERKVPLRLAHLPCTSVRTRIHRQCRLRH